LNANVDYRDEIGVADLVKARDDASGTITMECWS
jgi:hypothetical protein